MADLPFPSSSSAAGAPAQALSSSSSPSSGHNPQRPSAAPSSSAPQPAPRVRRRNRLITSCLECRRRKLKCDKTQPCGNCTRFQRDCVFLAPALDPAARLKLAEIKEKMGTLERTLEEDVARRAMSPGAAPATPGMQEDSEKEGGGKGNEDEEDSAPEDERNLEAGRYTTEDAAYLSDADDELVDLGIQMGKMRMTERIGGFVRPKFSEELTDILASLGVDAPPRGDFMGYQAPGHGYLAPSSSLLLGSAPQRASLVHYMPSKPIADKLVMQYWEAVHPIARIMHRPSFEAKYATYWNQIAMGVEPRVSFQAIIFATLLSAVISLPDDIVLPEYGVTKPEFVERFRQGTEAALCRANFLRTTRLETLQALVMYLIPLCRSDISRAHSALTGTAIRLAECMGLHRDGEVYGLDPVEVHVRRMVWYQLCFLDVRTSDATGPRPQIQADDFDTKFPLNVNDADFQGPTPPTEDSNQFTDMTLTRIRFECNEITRMIWVERRRIETKKTTLTSLLRKVEDRRATMERKYLPMLDTGNPLHYLTLHVYGIMSRRWHIAVLHRYSSTPFQLMPARLRNIMLSSGTLVLEHAMAIETNPLFAKWAWYAGALQQYHIALLLLSEMYATPLKPPEEARIWKCLDYVFEIPPGLSPLEKAGMVIAELRDRTLFYRSLRKMRAPIGMERPAREDKQRSRTSAPGFRPNFILRDPSSSSSSGSLLPASEAAAFGPGSNAALQNAAALGPAFVMPGGNEMSVDRLSGLGLASGAPFYGPVIKPGLMGSFSPNNRSDSSGSANVRVGAAGGGVSSEASPGEGGDQMRLDIDWDEWDKLFPPEINNTVDPTIPPFSFSDYSTEMRW